MILSILAWSFFCFLAGGFIGALAIVLVVSTKRNVEDVPETPLDAAPESTLAPITA